jgi:RNA polymerase sigma factor, sigma-70 family
MDESELIQGSRQGDVNFFNKLVELYQKQVYNLALRMLGNIPSAEDVTQDAFISAWKGIRSFKGPNFKAWLLRITANACRDRLRKLKRHPDVSLEASFPNLSDIASTKSAEDVVISRELADEIQRGLAGLPWEQCLAVTLCDIEGLSYKEIAQVMGCSLGTVRSRVSRGRTRLRDYLVRRGLLTLNSSRIK